MNYENISRAVEFYSARGYVYEPDAPWTVGHDAYYATRPDDSKDVSRSVGLAFNGYMVASGEQSFIQMMLDGQPLKRAICVTPCHRAEPRVDTLHRPYFMKAELINAQDVDEGHLVHMIHDACSFFEQFFSVRVVQINDESYDIVEKGTRMELGSYGIRTMMTNDRYYRWVYGTACAEPRLSTAIARHSKVTGR